MAMREDNYDLRFCSTTSSVSFLTVLFLLAAFIGALAQPQAQLSRSDFTKRLVAAAKERPNFKIRYVSTYIRIPYPGGDVPSDTGVCTDEIVRIYRKLGIDLQKEVHEDMVANFSRYPQIWKLPRPDTNIDHRRVPNLMVFFSRKGESLPITGRAIDYQPGEIVTWDLGNGHPHIGIVTDQSFGPRFGLVHNIGEGPKLEDVLFSWKITGHYRYYGPNPPTK